MEESKQFCFKIFHQIVVLYPEEITCYTKDHLEHLSDDDIHDHQPEITKFAKNDLFLFAYTLQNPALKLLHVHSALPNTGKQTWNTGWVKCCVCNISA